MKKDKIPRIFDTDKRIKMGIWGLGRGMNFYNTCKFLNIDVVAGCDFNEDLRKSFISINPDAFVTADADEFLKQDFDAVLLATFCPAHADDAIKCLRAGKHVLSEVTAFFTMAEGVRLVEEVEKHNLVYNLAENYPFSCANMWLANRWKEGLFGDLVYAEYEYVHETRSLCYTYLSGMPVEPGHTVHSWRSWINFHYYCTHSLGPVMIITNTRPTMVEAFPVHKKLPGYLPLKRDPGTSTLCPSLITMDNGGVVRNLVGASTNDTHHQRIWGTVGAFEMGYKIGLNLRLGGSGLSPKIEVNPKWEGLGEIAAKTGHGGGDFWVLYYFAREILTGEKAPFNIYGACDVTIPGIQAFRSSLEGGKPMEVPDFRKKSDRDRYRSDDWQVERYNTNRGVFAGAKLDNKAAKFTTVMKALIMSAITCRAYTDWKKVYSAMSKPEEFLPIASKLLDTYGILVKTYKEARDIVNAYPNTDGAIVLSEMLQLGEEGKVLSPEFLPELRREVASLKKKFGNIASRLTEFSASELIHSKAKIASIKYPKDILMSNQLPCTNIFFDFNDIRPLYATHSNLDGIIFARAFFVSEKASQAKVRVAVANGSFKVFINGNEAGYNSKSNGSTQKQMITVSAKLKKGENEIVVAIRTNNGKVHGFKAELIQGKE